MLTAEEYEALDPVEPDAIVAYGSDPAQTVAFYASDDAASEGPSPMVLVFHGGCWSDRYDRASLSGMCAWLRDRGFVVANVEFRRLGGGGGWPTTFDDTRAAARAALDAPFPVDPERVVTVGHSAGGHLALWLATQADIPIRGVVGLAPLADLEAAANRSLCGQAAVDLLGGADRFGARLAAASPAARLPLGVPHRHLVGKDDRLVPPDYVESFVARARAAGDEVGLTILPGAGHFDVVAPDAYPLVAQEVDAILG